MSEQDLLVIQPHDQRYRQGKVIPITPSRARVAPIRLKPQMEQAIRLYAGGQLTHEGAAAQSGKGLAQFSNVLNSPAGQAVVDEVRSQLNFKYQALFSKFIDVVDDGLSHPDPGVALAAASLYQRSTIGSTVNVKLSAEDIVKQIMDGTYRGE